MMERLEEFAFQTGRQPANQQVSNTSEVANQPAIKRAGRQASQFQARKQASEQAKQPNKKASSRTSSETSKHDIHIYTLGIQAAADAQQERLFQNQRLKRQRDEQD